MKRMAVSCGDIELGHDNGRGRVQGRLHLLSRFAVRRGILQAILQMKNFPGGKVVSITTRRSRDANILIDRMEIALDPVLNLLAESPKIEGGDVHGRNVGARRDVEPAGLDYSHAHDLDQLNAIVHGT